MIMTGTYQYSQVAIQYNKKLVLSSTGSLKNYTTIDFSKLNFL